ncbi:MAG: hypothetical protein KUG74_01735 [Rhodobacteraceae bacterium]|nr:hypothetical protein [Paracoccaceae bacterium]
MAFDTGKPITNVGALDETDRMQNAQFLNQRTDNIRPCLKRNVFSTVVSPVASKEDPFLARSCTPASNILQSRMKDQGIQKAVFTDESSIADLASYD